MTADNNSMKSQDHDIPDKQRALVLQGGGALGAYEVGVLKVLCEKLERNGHKRKDRPLFDIVAGSSMGAMNAAVLVSNVVNRDKSWEQAVGVLEEFWTDKKYGLSSNPDISKSLDDAKKRNNFSASPEAARRYYSVLYYLAKGTRNVCCTAFEPDSRFGQDSFEWQWYTSDLLQQTIERYSNAEKTEKLKIATSREQSQPRLLIISVDVAEGETVTFDSYYKSDHSNNPLYNDDGVNIHHIMASGTIPAFYKFKEIGGRKFCDGGWLSNTPFRELLQAHRDYWVKVASGDTDKIPDLDVYIVNVNPSKVDNVPTDYNEVQNRQTEITFLDRNSHYDEMVAHLATGYNELEETLNDSIGIIRKLKALKSHIINTSEGAAFQKELECLLMITEGTSNDLNHIRKKYKDLIKGKFKLHSVVRIERSNEFDPSTGRELDYSSKPNDFTHKTIKMLIEQGEKDALKILEGC
ncbi:MAG TPA: patatin-like phospholipase family protein [Nitrososphaeraceae archaeon]|jgi:predicted acylesterase/phospholipase RssA